MAMKVQVTEKEPPPIQKLPRITVQPDWFNVIEDVLSNKVQKESFWVSSYLKDKQSIHGHITISCAENPNQVNLEGAEGIEIVKISNYAFTISIPQHEINDVLIKRPKEIISKLQNPINAIDISPLGELFIVGGNNGLLRIGSLNDGSILRTLKGHKGDISKCLFFPSGKVILSSAMDMRIKIWSVEDGSNPVTLIGHTGAVRDLAIIEKGRNILSCSSDGTIKLWECGSGYTISTFGHFSSGINCMSVGTAETQTFQKTYDNDINNNQLDLNKSLESSSENNLSKNDTREVGIEGKIVIAGTSNGECVVFDLRSKSSPIWNMKVHSQSSINVCDYDAKRYRIATGSSSGIVSLFDTRQMSSPLGTFRRSEASIHSLNLSHSSGDILISSADGSPCRVSFTNQSFNIVEEFTGFDIDPVYALQWHLQTSSVYCGGRDGVLRRYE